MYLVVTLSQTTNFEDDSFKFDKNCRQSSKRVENMVGPVQIFVLWKRVKVEVRERVNNWGEEGN